MFCLHVYKCTHAYSIRRGQKRVSFPLALEFLTGTWTGVPCKSSHALKLWASSPVSSLHEKIVNFIKSFFVHFVMYWGDHVITIFKSVYCITFVDLHISNYIFILGIKWTWSWHMILLMYSFLSSVYRYLSGSLVFFFCVCLISG